MRLNDSAGRPVSGDIDGSACDDLWLTDLYYDDDDSEVPEDERLWIEQNHQAEMEFAWLEDQIGRAEMMSD